MCRNLTAAGALAHLNSRSKMGINTPFAVNLTMGVRVGLDPCRSGVEGGGQGRDDDPQDYRWGWLHVPDQAGCRGGQLP